MRLVVLITLLTWVLVPIAVVAQRSSADDFASAVAAAGCSDFEYDVQTRREVTTLAIAVTGCRDVDGLPLPSDQIAVIIADLARSTSDICFDAVALWEQDPGRAAGSGSSAPAHGEPTRIYPDRKIPLCATSDWRMAGGTSFVAPLLLSTAVAVLLCGSVRLVQAFRRGEMIAIARVY